MTRAPSALRFFAGSNVGIESGGLFARDAERLPVVAREMLREENYLADVMRIVGDLAIDCLHDRVRLAANGHRLGQIGIGQRFERVEDPFPTGMPLLHQLAACRCRRFEFHVSIPIRFFAVSCKEIAPAGTHIAGHVLHDDGDGIRFGVDRLEKLLVAALRHGAFRERFVVTENIERVFEIRISTCEWHKGKF